MSVFLETFIRSCGFLLRSACPPAVSEVHLLSARSTQNVSGTCREAISDCKKRAREVS